jgi:hypothetical protein
MGRMSRLNWTGPAAAETGAAPTTIGPQPNAAIKTHRYTVLEARAFMECH